MLDTEPTENNTTAQSTGESDTSAPAKKAARKPPAKRAPRKAATKKAAAVGDPADENTAADAAGTGAEPQPVEQPPLIAGPSPTDAASGTAADARPRKAARARKAPAKKAAPSAAPELADSTTADSTAAKSTATESARPESAPAGSAPAEVTAPAPAGDEPETAAAPPAKKVTRKRVSKGAAAAAAAAEQAASERAAAASDSTAEMPAPEALPSAAAMAAPAVLFQPPAEVKAPSRRRRGAKQLPVEPEPPVEPAPTDTVSFPEDVPDASELDADLDPEADLELEGLQADPDTENDTENDTDTEADAGDGSRRRRRRGRRGRGNRSADPVTDADADQPVAELAELAEDDDSEQDESEDDHADEVAEAALSASARRRRRRRRSSGSDGAEPVVSEDDPPNTVVHVRDSRSTGEGRGGARDNRGGAAADDGVRGVKGSTRLEAKRQRRRDSRDTGRRRAPILTEAEFLARRESVDRVMAVRQAGDRTQIAVIEDDILVEHYVTRASASSAVGNVYLGLVQNVLPSMEAAFVDIGRGRNGVLYAGEVNWDVAGLEGKARSIENALNPGDLVLVQVTKDPIGHKGARLTSQISLPGRFVVYVPGGGMTGISRKLPDVERSRLKAILKKVVPDEAGVIVRTAAEGASEQDLISDVERLKSEWDSISTRSAKAKQSSEGPSLVHGEPDLAIRVVRDIFNDDFSKLVVAGSDTYRTISDYVRDIAPDLADRISQHSAESDLFRDLRVDEQLMKALDRKVWLPSGGSLVIDRTEAMTVVDVNTGKYTGSGGNLEQTVTRNNLEAAEEIVRQLRLRDIGGIVVIDFIDMVLESNRDLVLRRLTECLGRDRTKHQVAEVTSLGLVQMTRKRVGEGLLEAFSEPCSICNGRGVLVHLDAVDRKSNGSAGSAAPSQTGEEDRPARGRRGRKAKTEQPASQPLDPAEIAAEAEKRRAAANAVASIAAATSAHDDTAGGSQPVVETVARSRNGRSRNGGRSAQDGSAQPDRTEHRSVEAHPATTESVLPVIDRPEAPAGVAPTGEATPEPGAQQSATAVLPRPRRRRAASRPAGPPVPVSATEG